MQRILLSLTALFTLTSCSLTASLLGGGKYAYTEEYRDAKGLTREITVTFTVDDDTITEFDIEGVAEGAEHGHQISAEANARALLIGKKVEEVTLPASVGDDAQGPVTGALREAMEKLKLDL